MKLLLVLIATLAAVATAADRPNIIWITCEDISPYLGCYGCREAQTPNLDALAAQGTRYTHAYANAPVCAVARSTLLTGMYSTSLGTHQMRSDVQLPAATPAYPKIFQKAGYYCTNNSKTDYNSNFLRDKTLWNESSRRAHWKNRADGQPFFAVFNITVTHEGQLGPKGIQKYITSKRIPAEPRINPADIRLPPYHPDLPAIRHEWARLHDLITHMDELVGSLLRELEEAGLDDNTIVFFYSDHGGQLARSKRFIYNVGTRVPLIVRFPKKWSHLAPTAPGQPSDRLVSFIDFPKTALSLAGLPVPDAMQGRIFLGEDTEPAPESVHLFRDRMAERYDFSRAVTDGRHYYIRNFMPHKPRGRDSRYGPSVQDNWVAWENHYDAGKCNAVQSRFFQPKPVVELFDTLADPWHVENLADQPQHQKRIKAFEQDLDHWMIDTRDLGLVPEPLYCEFVGPGKEFETLHEFAQSDQFPVRRVLKAARIAGGGIEHDVPACRGFLHDPNPIIRHWGAYGLFLANTKESAPALKQMATNDSAAANRVMAAQALAFCGNPKTAFALLKKEADQATDGYVFLFALNAIQYTHTDDQLTKADWLTFAKKPKSQHPGADNNGHDYAQRLIQDALALWPQRRRVD
jgi:arylsulfatase A-like enzyme